MALTDHQSRALTWWPRNTVLLMRQGLAHMPVPALVLPLAMLVLWQMACAFGWVPQQALPAPGQVTTALSDLWNSGDLLHHGGISVMRIVYGFAIGAGLGLLIGLGMGLSPRLEAIFAPTITAIAQVPLIGWLPFLIIVAGLGEAPKIIIIAKAAFLPVSLNAFAGVRAIPPQYFEVAHAFRFSRRQVLGRVVLPGSVGPMFTGLRYGLTKSWVALVAVELLASSDGLGYLLVWGRQMFWMDLVIATMIVIGITGYVLDRAFAAAENHMSRWRPERLG